MTYEQLKHLKPSIFKRKCGVHCETFEQMVELLRPHLDRTGRRGGQCKLSVEDQLLLVLEYWREYRTQFHIATRDFGGNNSSRNSLTSWGLSESAVCRLPYESGNAVDGIGEVSLTWEKTALPKCLRLERTGDRCYRSSQSNAQKKQRAYYSGKKKRHTLKAQVVVNQANGQIICTAFGKGQMHDFRLFKQYRVPMLPEQLCLTDKGYQGIAKLHPSSCTPTKKLRKAKLNKSERQHNRLLAQLRAVFLGETSPEITAVVAEHVNRRLKIFRILAERYRNRRRRFGLRFNLIAAILNFELALTS